MTAARTALPRRTLVSTLRQRRDRIADEVSACETNVERLRARTAAHEIVTAVRELSDARARLARVSRELRRAQTH
jgi:hypothetical protein